LFDEARRWGHTLRNSSIEVDDETGAIADKSYDLRFWQWRHTDLVGGEDIYVFVPQPDD
jgi:hypothetical protein